VRWPGSDWCLLHSKWEEAGAGRAACPGRGEAGPSGLARSPIGGGLLPAESPVLGSQFLRSGNVGEEDLHRTDEEIARSTLPCRGKGSPQDGRLSGARTRRSCPCRCKRDRRPVPQSENCRLPELRLRWERERTVFSVEKRLARVTTRPARERTGDRFAVIGGWF
jgi:hypothetical protein